MSTVVVDVPRTLYEEAVRRGGLNVEELLITTLIKVLNLDPEVAVRARLELAVKYLNEVGI